MQSSSQSFKFIDGKLHCENLNLEDLFNSIPVSTFSLDINCKRISVDVPSTPAFVYSKAALSRNVKKYLEAMNNTQMKGKLGYAVKANGNHGILQALKDSGVEMLVTVSGNEILAGLKAGFEAHNIILNGNGKQEWEIKLAIQLGALLNVDSIFDCQRIVKTHRENFPDVKVKVLLRICPSVPVHLKGTSVHPYVNTAETSKFGFHMTDLDKVLSVLESEDNISIHGIHCHLGSCIYDPGVYRCMGEIMTDMTNQLRDRGYSIEILDIGGGIGIDYHLETPGRKPFVNSEKSNSREEFDLSDRIHDETKTLQIPAEISQFMNIIADTIPNDVTVILEPGRSLVANAGIVICKVLGTKEAGDKRFVVVDASMAEIIRPCLYGSHHQIYPTTLKTGGKWLNYDVVGPICETADFLGRDVSLQMPSDYLAVMDVGAYCSSMSSNYNMRPRPTEILIDGSSWKYIRQRDTFVDLTFKM